MNSSNIIKFADKVVEICCSYGKTVKLNIPKIKVVGSQSAGKSTLIKRIIEYDILPMGENMVTRTPIHVRLHNVESQEVTLKLSYLNGSSVTEDTTISFQERSREAQQKQIEFKQSIMRLTDTITGGQKYNISSTPIFVDVYSQRVVNFTFVDLPGLIISASTDKGQPRDLKYQIDNLVKQELLEPNTIAMIVVRSGIDFATDLGIGLINEIKPLVSDDAEFHTIGVLTKPDLLDAKMKSDLNFTIAGKVTNGDEMLSSSESMTEGYYVVNNNVESILAEEKYFLENFDNTREIITEKRYCVGYLRNHLQTHLVNAINKLMPEIKNNLSEILKNQKMRSLQLGNEMETENDKIKYVISTISELSKIITNTMRDYKFGNVLIGSKIGEVQKTFLVKISNLDPFSPQNISDTELQSIIDSFNGFHLTSHVSIEQLLDRCIKDQQKNPIMLIKPISEEYVKSVTLILIDAMQHIFSKSGAISSINSYPKFKQALYSTIVSNIKKYENDTNKYIETILQFEESFVWSTDQKFREILNKHYLPKSNDDTPKIEKTSFMTSSTLKNSTTFKTSTSVDNIEKSTLFQYNYEPSQIRELASKYFATVVERTRDFIVKIVIECMTNRLQLSIIEQLTNLMNVSDGIQLNQMIQPIQSSQSVQSNQLNQSIQSIASLIVENPSTAKERQILKENIDKIEKTLMYAINNIVV